MGLLGNPNTALFVIIITFLFMVISFYYCCLNKNIHVVNKIVLLVGIVCLPGIGALVYWISTSGIILFQNVHNPILTRKVK
jgi:hypothetical protein